MAVDPKTHCSSRRFPFSCLTTYGSSRVGDEEYCVMKARKGARGARRQAANAALRGSLHKLILQPCGAEACNLSSRGSPSRSPPAKPSAQGKRTRSQLHWAERYDMPRSSAACKNNAKTNIKSTCSVSYPIHYPSPCAKT